MYRNTKVAVVIPAYNEEKLIATTIDKLPAFVDYIIVVNDGSKDKTGEVLAKQKKQNKKLAVLTNDPNQGIGHTLIRGYKYAVSDTDAEAVGIVAGDDQFDTSYLQAMLDDFIDHELDYVKASRFFHRDAFKTMPKYRQVGNIVISLLTKFSTGYYNVTDITNGCGFLRREIIERVNFDLVKSRYDYETSMLTALSIAGAKIRDHAVPAHYGEEKSTIKLLPTVLRNLRAVWQGFWQRIYYKYILYSFHPIALFLIGGLLLSVVGIIVALFLIIDKIASGASPSSGTVMLAVLPIILGFQMLMTSLIMDMNNEGKS
jgi:glycosyltransferase involved in cell wall biosynthesis